MAFAPPSKVKVSSNLAKSTWTPMNHPEANLQVFEERREIIQKWFQKWQDKQKRIIVNDILKNLSNKHLVSLHETLNQKFPQEKHDFTKILPRVLTLYLFSFLDPRTLCRCAQVSWYWNYLSEMDCLWRPKCLKFGWYPTYQPSPFKEKIWKRFYVNTVHELNYVKIKTIENKHESEADRPDTARSNTSRVSAARSTTSSLSGLKKGPTVPSTKKPLSAPKWQPPPWKGSDPHPVDTVRYNYLDNSRKSKKKNMSPGGAKNMSPGKRPSSKQGGRPQSSLEKSQDYQQENATLTSSRRLSYDQHNGGKIYDPTLDKTARLSGSTLANFAGGTTVPSPRLNKDFQLPHYKENDPRLFGDVGMPSTVNSTVQFIPGYPAITNQLNWSPQSTRNPSIGPLSQPATRDILNSANHGNGAKMFSSSEILRKSIDAGVRPPPVAKLSSEKLRKSKEINAASPEKTAGDDHLLATSNAEDLKGKGWKAPINSNSDDES